MHAENRFMEQHRVNKQFANRPMKENVAYKGFKDVNMLQHLVNGLPGNRKLAKSENK